MEFKRNAVDLTELAIGVLILGIITSIGAKILLTQRDSRLTDLDTVTTLNETITPSSTATLTNKWGKSVLLVQNATGGQTISSGNYTVTISDLNGQITVANTSAYPGDWNVSYYWYNTSRADWSLANDSALGIAEYGNWFKTIVIVGVAAVVLALIFMAFGRSQSQQQSGGIY